MSFVRFTPVMRFYWDVFRLSYAGHTFLSVCLAFDHACCLPHSAKQDGLRGVPFLFPPWVEIAGRAFSSVVRLSGLAGLLRVCAFLYGDPDGERRRRRERGDDEGTKSAALCECVFAQAHWLCHVFRGEFVGGCAPPNLRQRAIGSLDSLHLIRGVGAFHAARASRVQRRLERLQ